MNVLLLDDANTILSFSHPNAQKTQVSLLFFRVNFEEHVFSSKNQFKCVRFQSKCGLRHPPNSTSALKNPRVLFLNHITLVLLYKNRKVILFFSPTHYSRTLELQAGSVITFPKKQKKSGGGGKLKPNPEYHFQIPQFRQSPLLQVDTN